MNGSNSKLELLNDFNYDCDKYGLILNFNNCDRKYIDTNLIFIDKCNINNNIFQNNKIIQKYLSINSKNEIDHINEILIKTFNLKSPFSNKKNIDELIYDNMFDQSYYNCKTDDIPLIFGMYTEFQYNNEIYKLESIILAWATFLTYKNKMIKDSKKWQKYVNISKMNIDYNDILFSTQSYIIYISKYIIQLKNIDPKIQINIVPFKYNKPININENQFNQIKEICLK